MKKLILLFSFFLIISCQETKKTEEPTKLSSTAEAIKNYKINFEWDKGYEAWSKVPTTDDYHMSDSILNIIDTTAKIEYIVDSLNVAEGPLWDENSSSLLFTQVPKNKIYYGMKKKDIKIIYLLQDLQIMHLLFQILVFLVRTD